MQRARLAHHHARSFALIGVHPHRARLLQLHIIGVGLLDPHLCLQYKKTSDWHTN
jgi:hypothetical protein